MHNKNIITAGKSLEKAKKVLVMLHGRGGTAEDILSLARYLKVEDYALWAPQANNNSWYPLSFLAPPANNEPWLSSALALLEEIESDLNGKGIPSGSIYFLGFSQGACLALEYVARHAKKYGGVVAFTGGLVGERLYAENYKGDFENTKIFIGTSDPDPHVPVDRVQESRSVLEKIKANVTLKVYQNRGHLISKEEIDLANEFIFAEGSLGFMLTRLYSDSQGESHFEVKHMPLKEEGIIGSLSDEVPVKSLVFREVAPSYNWDFHTAPQRQYIILLDGEIEIETSLGDNKRFKGGDVLLLEDTTGKGHKTRNITPSLRKSVFILLP